MACVVAIFADVIAPYSPVEGDLRTMRLLPPSAAHLMGTDDLGRDIFSRVIHGSRLTLYIIVLVAVYLLIQLNFMVFSPGTA